jgi:TonB family protein
MQKEAETIARDRQRDRKNATAGSLDMAAQIPVKRRSLDSSIDGIDPDSDVKTIAVKANVAARKIDDINSRVNLSGEKPVAVSDNGAAGKPDEVTPVTSRTSVKDPGNVALAELPDRRNQSVTGLMQDISAHRTTNDLPVIPSQKTASDSVRNSADTSLKPDSDIPDSSRSLSVPKTIDDAATAGERSPGTGGLDVSGTSRGVDGDRDSAAMEGLGKAEPANEAAGGSVGGTDTDFEMSIIEQGAGRYSEPRLISYFAPQYPAWAEEKGLFGRVTLKIMVDELGVVTDSLIMESSIADRRMSDIARNASLKWKFARILLDGKPVNAAIRMVINFKLKGH